MGIKPSRVGLEEAGLHPLATWYADVFRFNRRKCAVLFNPATRYAVFSFYILRNQIKSLPADANRLIKKAMIADGISAEAAARGASQFENPLVVRTSDRRSRAFVVQTIKAGTHVASHFPASDAAGMEEAARRLPPPRIDAPFLDPVKELGMLLGETVESDAWLHRPQLDVVQLRVQLKGIEPPIWRRIVVPAASRLHIFHLVIQEAFGWTDSHLHSFEAGGTLFETTYPDIPEQVGKDEASIRLSELLEMGGGSAEYVYDYGDEWTHTIQTEERRFDQLSYTPRCLDGARACPPENIGGPGGYENMLEVLAGPREQDYESLIEWLPNGWTPEAFSVDEANSRILFTLDSISYGWWGPFL